MYQIIDEHAWKEKETLHAEMKISDEEGIIYTLFVEKEDDSIKEGGMIQEDRESFGDYYGILHRMIAELEGRFHRSVYEILQKRTRMTDNYLEKIPESEIEIQCADGTILYLFAYQAASYAEYGVSRISWLDQNELGEKFDRELHLLESYDSLQDSIKSPYALLFLELHEMMQNAEDYVDMIPETEAAWDLAAEKGDSDDDFVPNYYLI